jgi:hypothetical protein
VTTLHIHDRAADAARHLLRASALRWKLEEGALTVDHKSDRYLTVTADHRAWSDGEKALWGVLENFTASAPGLHLSRLFWMDEANREAVHVALGVYLGATIAIPHLGVAS